MVFGVSDNDRCISLPGFGWMRAFTQDVGMALYEADGSDISSVYLQSKAAIEYSRLHSKPSMLWFRNLPRRFGHAATDRQFAYLSPDEIKAQMDRDPLAGKSFIACTLKKNEYILTLTLSPISFTVSSTYTLYNHF